MAIEYPRGRVADPHGAVETTTRAELHSGVCAQTPPEKTQKPVHTQGNRYQRGSWWSHAAYGLGAVALIVPFLIPGVTRFELVLTYLGSALTLTIGLMLWGMIREGREAWRLRRRRH